MVKKVSSPWMVVFFQRHKDDDSAEAVPGAIYLNSCPFTVQREMFAILDAVAEVEPMRFRNSQVWKAMHGDMNGWYEARKKLKKHLCRVFCLLEREAEGLPGPSIVVITGMTKENETAFSSADYAKVRTLGDEYRARRPRSIEL